MNNINSERNIAARAISDSLLIVLIKHWKRAVFILLSLGLLLMLTSCDNNNSDDIIHIDKTTFSFEEQKAFGDNLKSIFFSHPDDFNPLPKSEYADLYNHLEAIYRTLSQTTLIENRDVFGWEITILEDDQRQMGFCGPGGHFFIYTGLLKYLKGEHELAALMAHEIHYANTGAAMESLQQEFGSEPFLLGDIFLGNEVAEGVDVCKYLRDHSYSTEEVQMADNFSMEIICPFQYNPKGLKELISRANGQTDFDWGEKRTGPANRLELLSDMEPACGNVDDDPTFSERYEEIISVLP